MIVLMNSAFIPKCLVNFSGCFGSALVQFKFVEKNWPKVAQRNVSYRGKKLKFGRMNSIDVQSIKFSIDQYIPRHSRINIYWDMGLQKHMTLKHCNLFKIFIFILLPFTAKQHKLAERIRCCYLPKGVTNAAGSDVCIFWWSPSPLVIPLQRGAGKFNFMEATRKSCRRLIFG